MHISVDIVNGVITGGENIISSVSEDEAVTNIIRDTLEDAKDGGHPEPKDVWADIAATLGITI